MSTYWYFECTEHDPPLQSEDEFTQHTDDAAFKRGVELALNRDGIVSPWVGEWYEASDYFERNARRFLVNHPKCPLRLVSEYGERRPVSAKLNEGVY